MVVLGEEKKRNAQKVNASVPWARLSNSLWGQHGFPCLGGTPGQTNLLCSLRRHVVRSFYGCRTSMHFMLPWPVARQARAADHHVACNILSALKLQKLAMSPASHFVTLWIEKRWCTRVMQHAIFLYYIVTYVYIRPSVHQRTWLCAMVTMANWFVMCVLFCSRLLAYFFVTVTWII